MEALVNQVAISKLIEVVQSVERDMQCAIVARRSERTDMGEAIKSFIETLLSEKREVLNYYNVSGANNSITIEISLEDEQVETIKKADRGMFNLLDELGELKLIQNEFIQMRSHLEDLQKFGLTFVDLELIALHFDQYPIVFVEFTEGQAYLESHKVAPLQKDADAEFMKVLEDLENEGGE
jgi:hypothetical protein